jgi:hypothetical protein
MIANNVSRVISKAVFPLAMFIRQKTPATVTCDSHYCTCLGHFGQPDTERIISIGQGLSFLHIIGNDI